LETTMLETSQIITPDGPARAGGVHEQIETLRNLELDLEIVLRELASDLKRVAMQIDRNRDDLRAVRLELRELEERAAFLEEVAATFGNEAAAAVEAHGFDVGGHTA
jgi:chromosome segregation ATPase